MTERALGSAILQLPRSKFRILFALDAGVVKDEFQVFPWDGVKKRLCAAQSRSELLRSAMRHSALWLYEKFAKAIGEEKADGPKESATEIWTLVPRAVLVGSMESLLSLLKSRWFFKKAISK